MIFVQRGRAYPARPRGTNAAGGVGELGLVASRISMTEIIQAEG